MGKVLGIDLGTTNSAVAVMMGNEPEIIPNAEEAVLLPPPWLLQRMARGWWDRWPRGRRLPIRKGPLSR